MARTPAQRVADAELDDAITAAAEAYGILPPGYSLVDFVCVTEGVRYDPDDPDEFDEYRGVLYRHGATRTTVSLGLLAVGEQLVRGTLDRFPPTGDDDAV